MKSETLHRIEGIVLDDDIFQLRGIVERISKDMQQDGFQIADAEDFIKHIVTQQLYLKKEMGK